MVQPEMTPVESSAVEAIGYNPGRQELYVRYTGGGVYVYLEVPAQVHAEFMDASSKGTFVNKEIKSSYQHRAL